MMRTIANLIAKMTMSKHRHKRKHKYQNKGERKMTQQEKEVRTKFTTLYIDPIVMRKIKYYTQAADGEVSGLGTVIKDDKGRHIVNNVFLLEQESSAADTELNSEAISKLMTDMINKNENPAFLKFWWHSHATMGVFWSGTDDACAETLSREYAFSLVVNKAGESKCRLDLYNPFRITFDGVKVTEISHEDTALKEECEKEVKEKVKTGRSWNWQKDQSGYDTQDYYHGGGYFPTKPAGSDRPVYQGIGKSRIKLPDHVVEDIERLMDLAKDNIQQGGVFTPNTWDEFIVKTMKEIFEKRFQKKAECNSPGTFDKTLPLCVNHCKVKKECAFWTKFFDEGEEDANKEEEKKDDTQPTVIDVSTEES